MADNDRKAALELAVRLLADRAHSRHEIESKLRKKGFDTETIVAVTARLDQLSLIDDRAFAGAYTTSLARRRPEGKHKTKARLRQKGLSDEIIDETLSSSDQQALCLAAAEKKRRTLSGPPEVIKKKLTTFLINRGFDWDTIRETVKKVTNKKEEEEEEKMDTMY